MQETKRETCGVIEWRASGTWKCVSDRHPDEPERHYFQRASSR